MLGFSRKTRNTGPSEAASSSAIATKSNLKRARNRYGCCSFKSDLAISSRSPFPNAPERKFRGNLRDLGPRSSEHIPILATASRRLGGHVLGQQRGPCRWQMLQSVTSSRAKSWTQCATLEACSCWCSPPAASGAGSQVAMAVHAGSFAVPREAKRVRYDRPAPDPRRRTRVAQLCEAC